MRERTTIVAARTPGCLKRTYPSRGNTQRPECLSHHNGHAVAARRSQLTDDGMTWELTGDQQATGGLRVGEQQESILADGGVDVWPHPIQVPSRATADVPRRDGLPGSVEVRHQSRVDDRGHSAGLGQLVEVAEQAEAGDVRG